MTYFPGNIRRKEKAVFFDNFSKILKVTLKENTICFSLCFNKTNPNKGNGLKITKMAKSFVLQFHSLNKFLMEEEVIPEQKSLLQNGRPLQTYLGAYLANCLLHIFSLCCGHLTPIKLYDFVRKTYKR